MLVAQSTGLSCELILCEPRARPLWRQAMMADVKARVQAAIAAREAAVKGAASPMPSPTAPMDASRYRVRQGCAAGWGRWEQRQCDQPSCATRLPGTAVFGSRLVG